MATAERRLGSIRRGMTVLGKVPLAPKPINLPSQKLERWGVDSDIEIVPRGTSCWGSNGRTPTVEGDKAVNGDAAQLPSSKAEGEFSSDNGTEGLTETSAPPPSVESDMCLCPDPGMTSRDLKTSEKEEEQAEPTGPTPNPVESSAPGPDKILDPGPQQTTSSDFTATSSDHHPASSDGTFADKSKPSISNHLGADIHGEGPEQEGYGSSEGVYGNYPPFGKQGPTPSGSGFYSFTPQYDGFYCPPHYGSMKDREMVIVAMVGSPGFFGGYLHPAHPEHYGRAGFYGTYPLALEHFSIPAHHASSRGGPVSLMNNGFVPERSDFFCYEGEGYSESTSEYKRHKDAWMNGLCTEEIQFGTWRGVSELGTSEMAAGVAPDAQKHSFSKPSRKNRDGSSGGRPRDYSRRTSKVESSSRMPAPDKPFILLTKASRSEGQSLNVVNLVLEDIQGSGNGQLASLTSSVYSRESIVSKDSPKLDSGGASSRNAIIIDEILDASIIDAKSASSLSSNKESSKVEIVDLSFKDIKFDRELKKMTDVDEPPIKKEGVAVNDDFRNGSKMQVDAVIADISERMKVEEDKVEQLSDLDVKTKNPVVKDPDINFLSSNKDLSTKEMVADLCVIETVKTDIPSISEKAESANSSISATLIPEAVRTLRPSLPKTAEPVDSCESTTILSEIGKTDRPSLSQNADSAHLGVPTTLLSETAKTSCEELKSLPKLSAHPDEAQNCAANLKLEALPLADGNKLKGRKIHKRVIPSGSFKPASAPDQGTHDSQSCKGTLAVDVPFRDDRILKINFNKRAKEKEWRPKSPLVKADVPATKTQVCKEENKVSPSQKLVIDGKEEALSRVHSSDTQCVKPMECQKAKKRLKEKEKSKQRKVKAHAKLEEISDNITEGHDEHQDAPAQTPLEQPKVVPVEEFTVQLVNQDCKVVAEKKVIEISKTERLNGAWRQKIQIEKPHTTESSTQTLCIEEEAAAISFFSPLPPVVCSCSCGKARNDLTSNSRSFDNKEAGEVSGGASVQLVASNEQNPMTVGVASTLVPCSSEVQNHSEEGASINAGQRTTSQAFKWKNSLIQYQAVNNGYSQKFQPIRVVSLEEQACYSPTYERERSFGSFSSSGFRIGYKARVNVSMKFRRHYSTWRRKSLNESNVPLKESVSDKPLREKCLYTCESNVPLKESVSDKPLREKCLYTCESNALREACESLTSEELNESSKPTSEVAAQVAEKPQRLPIFTYSSETSNAQEEKDSLMKDIKSASVVSAQQKKEAEVVIEPPCQEVKLELPAGSVTDQEVVSLKSRDTSVQTHRQGDCKREFKDNLAFRFGLRAKVNFSMKLQRSWRRKHVSENSALSAAPSNESGNTVKNNLAVSERVVENSQGQASKCNGAQNDGKNNTVSKKACSGPSYQEKTTKVEETLESPCQLAKCSQPGGGNESQSVHVSRPLREGCQMFRQDSNRGYVGNYVCVAQKKQGFRRVVENSQGQAFNCNVAQNDGKTDTFSKKACSGPSQEETTKVEETLESPCQLAKCSQPEGGNESQPVHVTRPLREGCQMFRQDSNRGYVGDYVGVAQKKQGFRHARWQPAVGKPSAETAERKQGSLVKVADQKPYFNYSKPFMNRSNHSFGEKYNHHYFPVSHPPQAFKSRGEDFEGNVVLKGNRARNVCAENFMRGHDNRPARHGGQYLGCSRAGEFNYKQGASAVAKTGFIY